MKLWLFIFGVIGALAGLATLHFYFVDPPPPPAPPEARQEFEEAKGNCEELRQVARKYSNNPIGAEAQRILDARSQKPSENWERGAYSSTTRASSGPVLGDEGRAGACQDAWDKARQNADMMCAPYRNNSARYRNVEVVVAQEPCDCNELTTLATDADRELRKAWRCEIRPRYECLFEERRNETREDCGGPE